MSDDIPTWAKERAAALIDKWVGEPVSSSEYIRCRIVLEAFARYIAAHEEAPVDPLLNEAREIVRASYPEMDPNYTGRRVTVALAALKRGMELAK